VLAAAIPRAAVPCAPKLDNWRTSGNFDANLGGVDRFWWSNADGSASRETFDEPTEARIYPGSWSGFQFLPIDTLPIRSWMTAGPFCTPEVVSLDDKTKRPEIIKALLAATYPPDTTRDVTATFEGDIARTRGGQRTLKWKDEEISIDVIDIKKALGWTEQRGIEDEGTFYMLTHIYAPEALSVNLKLHVAHGFNSVTGQLNGKPLPVTHDHEQTRIDEAQPLALQAGWNELVIREDHMFGATETGAELVADPAILWKLKVNGPPPAAP
jgi:hypothetical protein